MKSTGSSQFDPRWTSTLCSVLGHAGEVQTNVSVAPSVDQSSVIRCKGAHAIMASSIRLELPFRKCNATGKFQFTVVTRRITSNSFARTSQGDINKLNCQRNRATMPHRQGVSPRYSSPLLPLPTVVESTFLTTSTGRGSRSQPPSTWHTDELGATRSPLGHQNFNPFNSAR